MGLRREGPWTGGKMEVEIAHYLKAVAELVY